MSNVAAEHRATAPEQVRCAVVTVSDTRTAETDTGGKLIVELLLAAGHRLAVREIVPDDPTRLRPLFEQLRDRPEIDAVLVTGGTGIAGRDTTYETIRELLTKGLPGYGELFRMLSYQEIGAAAMLSRATAGVTGNRVVFSLPGSTAAVELAMTSLILPQLGHLVGLLRG